MSTSRLVSHAVNIYFWGKRNALEVPDIRVIIPALNEQNGVGLVIREIPKSWVREVIVVDNGSEDDTFQQAQDHGATALLEQKQGYGQACLKGMSYLRENNLQPEIVVFLDGDHSDYPEHLSELVTPIIENKADLVIGSRALGTREKGAMTPQQVFGNWLATRLISWFFGVRYTDLGPFRAIRYESLLALQMEDQNYGWTVEMQLKAAKNRLRVLDVPVKYRRRVGTSKISGTLKGTIKAGYKILYTIFRYL